MLSQKLPHRRLIDLGGLYKDLIAHSDTLRRSRRSYMIFRLMTRGTVYLVWADRTKDAVQFLNMGQSVIELLHGGMKEQPLKPPSKHAKSSAQEDVKEYLSIVFVTLKRLNWTSIWSTHDHLLFGQIYLSITANETSADMWNISSSYLYNLPIDCVAVLMFHRHQLYHTCVLKCHCLMQLSPC